MKRINVIAIDGPAASGKGSLAISIANKFSLNESLIKPVLTSELNQPARRPLQSGLSTEKLVNMLDIIPPSIDDCLDEIIKTIQ